MIFYTLMYKSAWYRDPWAEFCNERGFLIMDAINNDVGIFLDPIYPKGGHDWDANFYWVLWDTDDMKNPQKFACAP